MTTSPTLPHNRKMQMKTYSVSNTHIYWTVSMTKTQNRFQSDEINSHVGLLAPCCTYMLYIATRYRSNKGRHKPTLRSSISGASDSKPKQWCVSLLWIEFERHVWKLIYMNKHQQRLMVIKVLFQFYSKFEHAERTLCKNTLLSLFILEGDSLTK